MAPAARIPACRIPPPKIFLNFLARSINSASPATIDPTGAPRPFEKQTDTESAHEAYSLGDMPDAALAFQIRAPSRWSLMFSPRVKSRILRKSAIGITE